MMKIFSVALIVLAGIFSMASCDNGGSGGSGLPALTGTVSITGGAEVGQTLTADTSALGGTGTIAFQWMKGGATVIGTNSNTYVIPNTDIGSYISLTVTRSGNSGSVTSAATAPITADGLPALTGTITITGSAQVGQILTANTSALDGIGTITYQWMKGGATVIGTNSNTYIVKITDVGSSITVAVTRSGYSGSVISAATAQITSLTGKINAKFVTPARQNRNVSRSLFDQNEDIGGMHFALLDIVAHQYSPGFTDTGINGDYINRVINNWAHYIILDDRFPEARNIVLFNDGSEINLAALSHYQFSISEHFRNTYDNFSVDFMEINVSFPGVFFRNTFFGGLNTQEEAYLRANYPTLSNFSLYDFGFPFYPNMEGFPDIDVGFSIVFARSDWFPQPVFVRLSGWSYPETYSFEWSSRPLTEHQKRLVEGIASNPNAAWGRRSHIIIPYGNPVRLAVNEGATGMRNPEFRISFDFTQLLSDETYNNIISGGAWNQAPGSPNPAFTFKASQGIPFGLSVFVADLD